MIDGLLNNLENIAGGADDLFESRDDDTLEGVDTPDEQAPADTAPEDATAPIPGGGPLLEEPDEAKVFKAVDREVLRQERLARNRDEEGKHWDRIRDGVQFSILEKSEDQNVLRAVLPPGVEDVQQPIPNKVLDLCNKQVSQILVDPPLPNPQPTGNSDQNRSAMDLAKRFLRDDGDASGTNDSELWREALTLNRTRKSAFIYVWVDPTAGGWRPKQKLAHPRSEDPTNPLYAPELGADGQPLPAGANGQPLLERSPDPVMRYIGEDADGAEHFVDNASQAAREWLPKHRAKVLHPNQVRTLPPTATAFDAHSIILLMWEPLSEAKKRFPVLSDMTGDQLKELTTWKPKRWKSLVPEAMRPKGDGLDAGGEVSDDTLLFWYHKFCRISPDYPDGGEIAVTGAHRGVVLVRDTLREDVELEDGTTVPVLMEPPIAQFRALHDAKGGDPQGAAPVSAFGGANEIRAHLYMAVLEDVDVRGHPNTYLTSTSSVTREDQNRRDGTPIEVLTKDDMPIFEQRPEPSQYLVETLERVDHDMDTLANLNQTAQALDSSYSQSGEAKKVALRQAKVQLAQDWQGTINGCCQYWKIKLQLAQARLKIPMLVRTAGENSAFKARHFIGADLYGVSTAALQPGTGTMMSPAEKMQYLATAQGQTWVDKDEAASLFRSSMSDDLGMPPSPHEEHTDRCIADWLDGPPKGWLESYHAFAAFPAQQQQFTAALQQKAAAITSGGQQTGETYTPGQSQSLAGAQVGPAPVQPPEPYTPFEPRANDEEPVVAKIRYDKFSKLMSSVEYSKQPAEWRTCVDKAYTQACFAAGIVTIRQQQETQQQQQQTQQQQELAAQQAQLAARQTDQNAPPTWTAFLAAATKAVAAKAQILLVKEVEAMGESTSVGQKALPSIVPEETNGPPGPEPTHPLDLAHASMEAERDRAHQLTMQEQAHGHALAQTSAKVIGQALTKADSAAARQSGQPRPERGTDS